MAPIGVDRASAAQGVVARLKDVIRKDRIMTDALMTYAYSGDASSYRLVPAVVVIVNTEDEVRAVIEAARAERLPLTFRAAGTSLSGQAITEGVLAVLGDGWKKLQVHDEGLRVTLGPAVIVANANRALKPFNAKLGPDPASQATCKIGGVVNNNSSGMCCGVAYNTYHTMHRLRVMLVDGTVLDSGDPESVAAFRVSHAHLLAELTALHKKVAADPELVELIRKKYRIKNTVGYSINALLDFHDPIDILIHLIVGSEGTLGFVSEVTYNTIPEHPYKVTGLIPFPDPYSCARAISKLANGGVQTTTGVTAAEYIERRALQTVEHLPAIQPYVKFFTETSPVILIDISAPDQATLEQETAKASAILASEGATDITFSADEDISHGLWDVRKGFFATGGAARPKGTSMLTEDVAAPIDRLADFVIDMRKLLDDCGYEDAIIFGHALAGNLHFQMSDSFMDPQAAVKFDHFSKELSELVSVRYGGSLKAEHGTGRAIAPFVEAEWGTKAYLIMHEIKRLFDPEGLLNPGVLLNPDPDIHIKNLKLMPLADEVIDLCIECGFCEPACPSHHMTLSPRQRIAVTRERARLRQTGEDPERLAALDEGFQYAGLDTCAACNLCSLRCPVGIETGTMVIGERARRRTERAKGVAHWVADHTVALETGMKLGVATQAFSRRVVGDGVVDAVAGALHALAPKAVPRVSPALRPGPGAPKPGPVATGAPQGRVVYFPSCATRMFGSATAENGMLPTTDAMMALLRRAGFDPVVPEHAEGQCCGQPFLSKGFPDEAERVGSSTRTEIDRLSGAGRFPVLTDASTCAKHMREHPGAAPVADSAEFLIAEVLPRLKITGKLPAVAVHHNCSAQRLKEQSAIEALAVAIADKVVVLDAITCCGYAGDKGLYVPELNAHATRFAKAQIPEGCEFGLSTVSTCATGLSERMGIPFFSIASLLERVSR
ncbi:FAD-binding and (Fe-S)-binding domain-containing protein [Devosia sp. ZB163]|uniref:FAD-binding and (Fe-S)-binding domain-containing protein n=1 Tax=Devosia sp. ZB163 TaxID=3025938 RepID=UPI0023630A0F|nr:FAD-binding and (Fe-S)-binding domain-containing protein [Devosia sp. ZB163]MDC9822329.1 FAD-binding and (Fe-S)-binding domain-containing protein [Devosia sp. ZB163]